MVPQSISEFPLPSGLFPGAAAALPLCGGRFSGATPGSSRLLLLPPINARLALESLPAQLCLQMFL